MVWWDLNFDYWAVVNLAAGHSAENEIEHCWTPLSECVISVTLPGTLHAEDKTPSLQSELLQEEEAKNAPVLDLAMNQILGYMSITRWFPGY